jgi:ribosome-binding protein aMBF1 (putative translation factor)
MTSSTQCSTGKRKFRNQQTAEQVLSDIWRTPRSGRTLENHAYQCAECLSWHLTSQPPRKTLPMPEPRWEEIGPRIRQAREDKGLDLFTCALRVGCTALTLERYEEGSAVSPKRLEKISEVTGRSEFWLRYGRDPR